ncbi:MAG: PAS domain-containing sensor histidine kinase [Ignavibacteria bacterium]|nr:PAS domain-containing sensor histidine kinase [Ignavibacteria bacterium]
MRIKSDKSKTAGENTGESKKNIYFKKENTFLKAILSTFPLSICVKDVKSGKYIYRNDMCKEQDAITENKLKSITGKKLTRKEITTEIKIQDDKIIKSGKTSESVDKIIFTDTSEEKWFRTLKIPLQIMSRKPNYLIRITEDITEKVKLEDKITEYEKENGYISEKSASVILIIDLKTKKIKKVNKLFKKITGLKAGIINNRTIDELGLKLDTETRSNLSEHIRNRSKINNENIKIKFGNKEFTGQISADVITFRGKPSLLAVFNDRTDIISTKAELIEKENLLRKIFDTSPGIIYIYDYVKKKNIYINNKITPILGYLKKELKNQKNILPVNFLHPFDIKKYNSETLGKLHNISGDEMLVSEIRLRVKGKKEYKWMREHITVLEMNDTGEVKKVLGILTNISDYINAEKELKSAVEKLDYANQVVNYGHWEYNMAERKLKTSEEINSIFEIRSAQKSKNKQYFINLIPEEDRVIIENARENIMKGKTEEVMHRIILPSGKVKYINSKIKPVTNEEGKILILNGISCDVTEKTESEIKLQQLENELYKSIKNNERYLSIVTDDLRKPLTGLLGFSSVLENEYGILNRDDIYKYIKIINSSLKSVYNLTENLLQWSKISTGKILFIPEKIDLKAVSENARNILKQEADSKNITVKNEIKQGYYVQGDENMLRSVMQNLLSNSIKFSNEGDSIVLSSEEKGKYYEISVSDTGIGMKPEVVENLFNIYEPRITLGTKNEKGAGLGLILCKEFIRMHNSSLEVNSEEGIGTTFYFKLKKI